LRWQRRRHAVWRRAWCHARQCEGFERPGQRPDLLDRRRIGLGGKKLCRLEGGQHELGRPRHQFRNADSCGCCHSRRCVGGCGWWKRQQRLLQLLARICSLGNHGRVHRLERPPLVLLELWPMHQHLGPWQQHPLCWSYQQFCHKDPQWHFDGVPPCRWRCGPDPSEEPISQLPEGLARPSCHCAQRQNLGALQQRHEQVLVCRWWFAIAIAVAFTVSISTSHNLPAHTLSIAGRL